MLSGNRTILSFPPAGRLDDERPERRSDRNAGTPIGRGWEVTERYGLVNGPAPVGVRNDIVMPIDRESLRGGRNVRPFRAVHGRRRARWPDSESHLEVCLKREDVPRDRRMLA